MRKLFTLIIAFGILSCANTSIKKPVLPNGNFTPFFKVNNEKIKYQFIQEFGFTDLCEHKRCLAQYDTIINLSTWKKLPLTTSDLKSINIFENKVDSIQGETLQVNYQFKNYYDDIELLTEEYIVCDTSYTMSLRTGYYKLFKNGFAIINENQKLLYQEHHSCDNKD